MQERYTISECAALCNTSARTLRYYDEMNIVKPMAVDPDSGYRYYSSHEIDRLVFVQMLKELGMSLREIEQQMREMDFPRYQAVITHRRQKMEEELRRTQLRLRRVQQEEQQLAEALQRRPDTCFLVEAPPHRGLVIPHISADSAEDHRFRHAIGRKYGFRGLPRETPKIISRENLLAGKYSEYTGFYLDGRLFSIPEDEELTELPARTLAVCHSAVWPKRDQVWERLMYYIDTIGYEVAGDGAKSILLEKGILADPDAYLGRFSVPVRKRR